ncbi:MAG: hypothetical protein KIS78_10965 [Labilithrix sp.]|nr:hypothetical protein [Labilithrix sp.]
MMSPNATRALRTLLFASLLGVLGFKGDACICKGNRPPPPPPITEPSAPSTPDAAAPIPPG